MGDCITCVAQGIRDMLTWRHPHLPPTTQSTIHLRMYALCRGQSRLTNITDNEGCVRYPTEGNNSSHELTTAMHHLTNCLATTIVSYCLQLD